MTHVNAVWFSLVHSKNSIIGLFINYCKGYGSDKWPMRNRVRIDLNMLNQIKGIWIKFPLLRSEMYPISTWHIIIECDAAPYLWWSWGTDSDERDDIHNLYKLFLPFRSALSNAGATGPEMNYPPFLRKKVSLRIRYFIVQKSQAKSYPPIETWKWLVSEYSFLVFIDVVPKFGSSIAHTCVSVLFQALQLA